MARLAALLLGLCLLPACATITNGRSQALLINGEGTVRIEPIDANSTRPLWGEMMPLLDIEPASRAAPRIVEAPARIELPRRQTYRVVYPDGAAQLVCSHVRWSWALANIAWGPGWSVAFLVDGLTGANRTLEPLEIQPDAEPLPDCRGARL